jgi:hypothetical protein
MKGAWLALVILFVCPSWAQSQNASDTPRGSSPKESQIQQKTDSIQRPAKTPQSSGSALPSLENASGASGQFDKQNLQTQVRIAEATREEAHAAWAAAGVMGVETVIAALALFFLVRTYRETKRTADAAMETARTAHREFIASHRPRMVVRAFRLSRPEFFSEGGPSPGVTFVVANVGESEGKVTEVRGSLHIGGDGVPPGQSFPLCERFTLPTATLASGADEVFPLNNIAQLDATDAARIVTGQVGLYYVGEVVYVDGARITRKTGFCRRYHPGVRRWEIIQSEYEHAD